MVDIKKTKQKQSKRIQIYDLTCLSFCMNTSVSIFSAIITTTLFFVLHSYKKQLFTHAKMFCVP